MNLISWVFFAQAESLNDDLDFELGSGDKSVDDGYMNDTTNACNIGNEEVCVVINNASLIVFTYFSHLVLAIHCACLDRFTKNPLFLM